jgi:MarR family 2-MHQ and catechol resistance regulon transcriptional repressor
MPRKPEPHDLLVALLLVQSRMERRSEAFFAPLGLTAAQFNILNLLGYQRGRMDQAELVERLLVGKSSVSIVLNRMVRNGWVRRDKHERDRRQVVLALTARGQALWRRISPDYEKSVDRVFGALPASRRSAFVTDLQALHANLLQEEGEDAEATQSWSSHFAAH